TSAATQEAHALAHSRSGRNASRQRRTNSFSVVAHGGQGANSSVFRQRSIQSRSCAFAFGIFFACAVSIAVSTLLKSHSGQRSFGWIALNSWSRLRCCISSAARFV